MLSQKPTSLDKCVKSSNTNICKIFQGFSRIHKRFDLQCLTSVSFETFYLLFLFLPLNMSIILNQGNGLFLFLIKMKMEVSFTVLGTLFAIHGTIYRKTIIFLNVLDISSQNLQILYSGHQSHQFKIECPIGLKYIFLILKLLWTVQKYRIV